MPRDDSVELRERLGLPDGEERLDPALRSDRLDPDVVSPVDEREAEAGSLGAGASELLPHALGARLRLLPG